jgi:hypothetical protein
MARTIPFPATGARTFARLLGEWSKPIGPVGGEPPPSRPPVRARVPAQEITPASGYIRYGWVPMRRMVAGWIRVYVNEIQARPVTAYPVNLPRVERSGIQPMVLERDVFEVRNSVGAFGSSVYPKYLTASTRQSAPGKDASLTQNLARSPRPHDNARPYPGGSIQPGLSIRRSAGRVPRYSTIPNIRDIRPANQGE